MNIILLFALESLVEEDLNIDNMLCWGLKSLHTDSKVPIYNLISFSLDTGHADEVKEVESIIIGEEGVPETNHIAHVKFLAHKQHDPPKCVELMVDILIGQVLMHLWV